VKGNGGEVGTVCLPTCIDGDGGSDPGGGATAAQWFYLMNRDQRDDVWWSDGRCHPIGGPDGGVNQ
jgi:hypothetical protein